MKNARFGLSCRAALDVRPVTLGGIAVTDALWVAAYKLTNRLNLAPST